MASNGLETVCQGRGGDRITLLGNILALGPVTSSRYGGTFRELYCNAGGGQGATFINISKIATDTAGRRAMAGLWPLKVGKQARINLILGFEFLPVAVNFSVSGTKTISVAGREHAVFEITGRSEMIHCPPEVTNSSEDSEVPGFRQTWFYSPELGAVVGLSANGN